MKLLVKSKFQWMIAFDVHIVSVVPLYKRAETPNSNNEIKIRLCSLPIWTGKLFMNWLLFNFRIGTNSSNNNVQSYECNANYLCRFPMNHILIWRWRNCFVIAHCNMSTCFQCNQSVQTSNDLIRRKTMHWNSKEM